ncbi:exported hypothetical protein [Mesorhizobium sp. ORS 3359]|nr:exported hypothetical protein [Mesorhizobium sp. ORS 3359]
MNPASRMRKVHDPHHCACLLTTSASAFASETRGLRRLIEKPEFGYGWTAQRNEFGGIFNQGVIDPLRFL